MRAKIRTIALSAALLFGCTAPAHADPFTAIAFIAQAASSAAFGAIISATTALWIQGAAIIGGALYHSRKAKKLRAQQIRDYNASLKDYGSIAVTADPDVREVYGTRNVGGHIVAAFSSDKLTVHRFGVSKTKPDAYKHIVIALCRGPVEAIEDVLIAGESVGPLDGEGFVTTGDYYTSRTGATGIQIDSSGFLDLPHTAIRILSATEQFAGPEGEQIATTATITMSGTRIEAAPGTNVEYEYEGAQGYLKVTKYLGTEDQTADAFLISKSAGKWTTAHQGKGWAYVILTLDLEHEPFQSGMPDFSFKVKGRMVYDPRLDSTNGGVGPQRYDDPDTWTFANNSALVATAHLMSDLGFNVDPAIDINWPSVILAANESDATTTEWYRDEEGTLVEGDTIPKYTCDGVVSSFSDPETVLEAMCQTMGGFSVYGADWSIYTGTWRAPVRTLTDDDLDGEISILQTGTGIDELFNGVKGTFVLLDEANPTDLVPYQNAAYLAADDGIALWTNVTYQFTNNRWRAAHVSRMALEQNRLGLIIQYPGKLHLWPLAVSERVLITNAEYGYVNKPFLILNWQFDVLSAVVLTLQEDEENTYDEEDETSSVSKNPPNLPNPNVVVPLANFALATGEAHVVVGQDGTIEPGVLVTWDLITDRYAAVGGYVELAWYATGATSQQTMRVPPLDTSARISGVSVGTELIVQGTLWNGFARSIPKFANIRVVGDLIPPGYVSAFNLAVVPGGFLLTWQKCTDRDFKRTVVRQTTWNDAVQPYWTGNATELFIPWPVDGTYVFLARNEDTSGNLSEWTISVTIVLADLTVTEMTYQWLQSDGTPGDWLISLYDDETEELIGYESSSWIGDGVGQSLIIDWSTVGGDGVPADGATRNVIWYQAADPSIASSPANGDIWYDTDDDNHMWVRVGGSWVDARDAGIAEALLTAENAIAIADGKIVTFYQASAPTALAIGDIWFDTDDGYKQYRWSGAAWVIAADTRIGDAINDAADAQATADSKVTTFVATSAPTADAVGDIWYDSDDGYKPYRWSGSAWVSVQDLSIAAALSAANDAQATADGKIVTFYQSSAPTASAVGDIWFDTDDDYKQYRWSGSAWVLAADTRIGQAINDAADAQATADGKIVTFIATSAPTAEGVGDLWIDSDDGNKQYRWNGSSWVAVPLGTSGLDTEAATKIQTQLVNGNTIVSGTGGMVGTFPNLSITKAGMVEIAITATITVTNNAVDEALSLFVSFSGAGSFIGPGSGKFWSYTSMGTGGEFVCSIVATVLTTGAGPWSISPYFQGPGSANTYDIDNFMVRVTEVFR